jgi:hypothetical protein
MLQANRTLRASELGKRLGETTHYGPTYVLIISAFRQAFPDIPEDTVTLAALAWRGVGGRGSDAEFCPWVGPVSNEEPNR